MAGKIRLAADLGAQRRIRGKLSKGHQPAAWRVARLAAAHPSENLIINPDAVQPAIRQVDAFVTPLPRVCRSLRSLLNSLTTFNPRRARVVPVLSDSNIPLILAVRPFYNSRFCNTHLHRACLRPQATHSYLSPINSKLKEEARGARRVVSSPRARRRPNDSSLLTARSAPSLLTAGYARTLLPINSQL